MNGAIDNPRELGTRIRERRREVGLTQGELADVARVTPRLLSEVEHGKPTAQLDGVLRILAALGLRVHLKAR